MYAFVSRLRNWSLGQLGKFLKCSRIIYNWRKIVFSQQDIYESKNKLYVRIENLHDVEDDGGGREDGEHHNQEVGKGDAVDSMR